MYKKSIPEKLIMIMLAGAAIFVLASCSGDTNADRFPQVASPPPFDYVDGDELRSGMHQLAFAVLNLDAELANENTDEDPIDQQDVIDNLKRIQEVAQELHAGDIRSSHPYLAGDMFRFLNDVDQAIWQASLRSPRYYMAGRVSGACAACHQAVQ